MTFLIDKKSQYHKVFSDNKGYIEKEKRKKTYKIRVVETSQLQSFLDIM